MGRKKLSDLKRETVLDGALRQGMDFDKAWALAMFAADTLEENRRNRRRAQHAERQRRYRARRLKPGFYSEPGDPPKKALTLYLDEDLLAVLDREARQLADMPMIRKDLPMSHWRSSVVASLLIDLKSKHEKQARKHEQNIHSLQMLIESARSEGESEENIERHVAKSGVGMTVDEIMAYQFQYAASSAQTLPSWWPHHLASRLPG